MIFLEATMSRDLREELTHHFGFHDFRPGQYDAITHLLNRRNALVVMPTGAGKSLCYQMPAVMNDDPTLVVSPLISLMKDQVDALRSWGISATFINSSLTGAEQARRIQALREGQFRLVYVAPERFRSSAFLSTVAELPINLFVVDEAHCISQWGHDFRPDYLALKNVITHLKKPTVAALTATATVKVQEDIIEQLGLQDWVRIVTGFNRPNLFFEVGYTADDSAKLHFLQELLQNTPGSIIIYTGTRREAEEVAEFVTLVCKRKTGFYHAGLEASERERIQNAFMANELSVIVATNAFGMGVDKPDIRCVVHYNLPGSLEAYYQEVGRAGRDGEPAQCFLLYSPNDRALQEWFIENDAPSRQEFEQLFEVIKNAADQNRAHLQPGYVQRMTGLPETKVRVGIAELVKARALRDLGDDYGCMNFELLPLKQLDMNVNLRGIRARRRRKYELLNEMVRYAEGNDCRRQYILQHFGDPDQPDAEKCCDNCLARESAPRVQARQQDEYTEAEKAALIILHAVKHLRRGVGRSGLAKVLTGSKAKNISEFGWDKTRHYGRLAHLTQALCMDCMDQLLKDRYLKLVGSDYPILGLTPKGEEALRHLTPIPLNLKLSPTPAPIDSPLRHISGLPETVKHTLHLFREGLSAEEIAEKRGLTLNTIYGHFSRLVALDLVKVSAIVPINRVQTIQKAIRQVGTNALKPIKEVLPDEISYDEIRCVVEDQIRRSKSATLQANPDFDRTLFEKLRDFRRHLSRESHLPPFVFFHDSVLESLATHKPQSFEALQHIKGLGEKKIASYGTQLLEMIRNSAAAASDQPEKNDGNWPQDSVREFLSGSHPRPLKGPWKAGYALDFHSRHSGAQWQRSEIGKLVYQLKYNGEIDQARVLADKLLAFVHEHPNFRKVHALLNVPPSLRRSFDPVSAVTEHLAKGLRLRFLKNVLTKVRDTAPQKEMTNLVQKRSNVQGAFAVQGKIHGLKLLLLDDLYDSGATLEEAANTLRRAGSEEIYVLTLTKTIHADT